MISTTNARVLFLAAALAASVSGVACADHPASAPEATAEAAAPEVAVAEPAPVAEATSEHAREGFPLLGPVDDLDLRPEQRTQLETIQTALHATLAPSRQHAHEMATLLAAGIEKGRVDEAAVASKREAVDASVIAARSAIMDAANAVHGVLDADQRSELVLTMRAHRDGQRTAKEIAETSDGDASAETPPGHGLHGLASELGLSDQQQRSLRDGARSIFEAAFPQRKARREQMEAEMKAAEDAFMSDDFDAHRYSFGRDAVEMFHTAAGGAAKLSDLAASVLTSSQRASLAAKIRAAGAERE